MVLQEYARRRMKIALFVGSRQNSHAYRVQGTNPVHFSRHSPSHVVQINTLRTYHQHTTPRQPHSRRETPATGQPCFKSPSTSQPREQSTSSFSLLVRIRQIDREGLIKPRQASLFDFPIRQLAR
ncbi:uncharacterized protein BKA78DRAFT_301455 [Phyllosticta capitalensis]|uniref:uncharacterized protein n=1 Tax=Phyllosticta capitalensis TaxID=121624 RepID=UPI00312FD4BE